MDQFNDTAPIDGVIGWIESDGVPGKSDDDTVVYVGDSIENDVVVYTLCYNCTCGGEEIECQQKVCEVCQEGYEEYYVEGDCCPRCKPVVEETCQLREETKVITFTDENGAVCVTPEEVTITYCAGGCQSYDSSAIYTFDGQAIVHNKECKCCTGEGDLVAQDVKCGSKTRSIQIKMFHTCGCNKCDGAEELAAAAAAAKKAANEKKPKHARRSLNHAATLPEEYMVTKQQSNKKPISKKDDIAFNTKLVEKVTFEPAKAKYALMDSPTKFSLDKDSKYMNLDIQIDRPVESISFVTQGKGEIRMDVIDTKSKFILKKTISEGGSHTFDLKGQPLDVMFTLLDNKTVSIADLIIKYKPESQSSITSSNKGGSAYNKKM